MFASAIDAYRSRPGFMTDQIVITEKSSQAKDVCAAVGSRYGAVLPAEGHLLDLCEPEDVNLFTAQDAQTIREAFGRARPNFKDYKARTRR